MNYEGVILIQTITGGSQAPITPAPVPLLVPEGSVLICTHEHANTHTHICKNKQNFFKEHKRLGR